MCMYVCVCIYIYIYIYMFNITLYLLPALRLSAPGRTSTAQPARFLYYIYDIYKN